MPDPTPTPPAGADPTAPPPGGTVADPTTPPATPPTPPPADPPATPPADPTDPESVDKLPAWAQKLVGDLRKENAGHRTAKTKAEKDATEAARKAAEEQGQFKTLYETEKAAREVAEKAKTEAELAALRSAVGTQYKLPAELHSRLKGETKEELEADAKALFAALPKPAASTDGGSGTNPTPPKQQYTDEQLKEMAAVYGVSFEHLKAQFS